MKKIKKMDEVQLNLEKLKELVGGRIFPPSCSYDTNGPEGCPLGTDFGVNSDGPTAPPQGCGCGCAGCIWEDGGSGFSVGMAYNQLG